MRRGNATPVAHTPQTSDAPGGKPWRPSDPDIAAWLDRVVAEAPPMSDDVCARVARILFTDLPAGREGGATRATK